MTSTFSNGVEQVVKGVYTQKHRIYYKASVYCPDVEQDNFSSILTCQTYGQKHIKMGLVPFEPLFNF
jgi:hypothetical protein